MKTDKSDENRGELKFEVPDTIDSPQRISKLLSQRGLCSRREADLFIQQGLVQLNSKVADLGERAKAGDTICLTKGAKTQLSNKLTVILNKPIGFVSAGAVKGERPARTLLLKKNMHGQGRPVPESQLFELAPAGRLDINSKGLLILSSEGAVVKKVIAPDSPMTKEYIVKLNRDPSEEQLQRLNQQGMELDGRLLKPMKVERLRAGLTRWILTEGRKRQIRRLSEELSLEVLILKRVRVGPIELGDLPEGCWRHLTKTESSALANFSS